MRFPRWSAACGLLVVLVLPTHPNVVTDVPAWSVDAIPGTATPRVARLVEKPAAPTTYAVTNDGPGKVQLLLDGEKVATISAEESATVSVGTRQTLKVRFVRDADGGRSASGTYSSVMRP